MSWKSFRSANKGSKKSMTQLSREYRSLSSSSGEYEFSELILTARNLAMVTYSLKNFQMNCLNSQHG